MPSERRVMMLLLNRLTTLKDDLLNEEIHGAIIDGITVFVLPKKGFRRKYAEVFINYGSNDNAFIPYGTQAPVHVPPGIAHFLEHKMFEKPWGEAFSAFASIGASANAYTGNNYTSYLFWTLENYEKALELLMEVVFSPYFTDETVEKEKGIISQEIRMYEDQPSSRLFKETISTPVSYTHLARNKWWQVNLTGFIKDEGQWCRFDEIHRERAFPIEDIAEWLEEAGFIVDGIYEPKSMRPASATTLRAYFAARKP